MIKEFREFAVKGNVVDLAVGLIIGGAFAKIVDSLVKDILMPPIGVVLKGVDFSNLKIVLLRARPAGVTTTTQEMVREPQTTATQVMNTVTSVSNATEE